MTYAVAIVDYGMGNLKSVINALSSLGHDYAVVSEPEQLKAYERVIIPGVGAFSEAMANLRERGLDQALVRHVDDGRPILGICLGMQLLCTESTEDGAWQGFDWIKARVLRFPRQEKLKVPHMGWNSVTFKHSSGLFTDINDGADFYFVHSYYVDCEDSSNILGVTEHGLEFASVIQRDNVFGAQFHPEKSQHVGITLLKNFLEMNSSS